MQRHAMFPKPPMRGTAHWACQPDFQASRCREACSGKGLEGIRVVRPMVFTYTPANQRHNWVMVPQLLFEAQKETKQSRTGLFSAQRKRAAINALSPDRIGGRRRRLAPA